MTELKADALRNDPAFYTAANKILDTVNKHRNSITGIVSPDKERKLSYEETIKTFGRYRGMDLFYPYLGSGIGNGALVELDDGSVKYDFISGIGVHFGHSHPTLISASIKAAIEDCAMQGHLQQTRSSFSLTKLLAETSGMDHVVLTTSGAMANENALKLMFQKKNPAQRILAFEKCFMGRTLALANITDKAAVREGLPSTLQVDYIPFYDHRNPHESTKQALQVLEKLLKRYSGQYAGMCFEMIQGEAGFYPGNHDFFAPLMEKLKEHGVAILVDEVQTFGRTESLFAFQSFGLQDYVDIVTVGKLLHTCATLYKEEFRPKPGLIAQTYTAATASIYGAEAIIHSLIEEGYLGPNGKNMQIRKRFLDHLQRIAKQYPDHFEGPFGHGLMIAATPFQGDFKKVLTYLKALFEAGVVAFMAGKEPTRIRFLVPAGGVTDEAIDQVARILEQELVKCLNL